MKKLLASNGKKRLVPKTTPTRIKEKKGESVLQLLSCRSRVKLHIFTKMIRVLHQRLRNLLKLIRNRTDNDVCSLPVINEDLSN